jgi:hypothetical protein
MNKKLFYGITAVTVVAGTVAGAVYYRHVITEQLDRWLQDEDVVPGDEETDLVPVKVVGPEEYRRIQEHLEQP